MSPKFLALVIGSAALLAGCSPDNDIAAPRAGVPTRAFVINPAAVCNGATMPVAECAALVAIYNNTNGAGWRESDNWGVNPNPCTWKGVECAGGLNGSVKTLKLNNNTLVGALPASIGNLTALEEIQLQGNELSGALPSLASLTSLKSLNVNSNAFTGTFPMWLIGVTSLEYMLLAGNQFTGTIPPSIASMPNLIYLSLGHNQFTGGIPAELGTMSQLLVLEVRANQLTGSIPPALGNLTNLRYLQIDENQLTGSIPSTFGNVTGMTVLTLYGNQLSGLVPLSFAIIAEQIEPDIGRGCYSKPGNEGLYMPDTPAYRAADTYADGLICDIGFSPAEDIGEDAVDEIDDLVPATLNSGQANALKAKMQNAMEKAAKGQYAAAINQMQSFIGQVNDMVTSGTLTPAQAAPFVDQAESLIAIWTAELP